AAADPFLDEVVGGRFGEPEPAGLALLAEPEATLGLRQNDLGRPARTSGADRDPPGTARAPRKSLGGLRGIQEMDEDGGVSRRDHIAFTQSHMRDAQAVHLGSVGASQVDQVAKGGFVFYLEMLARQDKVLRHRKLRMSRTPNRKRFRMVNLIFLAGVRAASHFENDRH